MRNVKPKPLLSVVIVPVCSPSKICGISEFEAPLLYEPPMLNPAME